MSFKKESLVDWMAVAISSIYSIPFLLVLFKHFFTFQVDVELYWTLIGLIFFLVFSPPLLRLILRLRFAKRKETIWGLVILGLAVKLGWVFLFRVEPQADYLTFHKTAQMLAESWTIHFPYVALFPHIMGYASFLSLFYFIFGSGSLVAPLVNVVLSIISLALIYEITEKIFNRNAAMVASILWIFLPSQTIYNAYVLSEPLYTTMILAFWALIIRGIDQFGKNPMWKIGLTGGSLAILLGLIQATRPIATILYIAMVIWFLLFMDWKNKQMILKKIGFLLIVGLGFWLFNQASLIYNSSRLGEEIAKNVGYSIYVGFNEDRKGKWNQEDSDHLIRYVRNHPEWTANDVQNQMWKDAKERITSGKIHFLSLFYEKNHVLWGDDAMAYKYANKKRYQTAFSILSNAYYYFIMLFSIIGMIVSTLKNKRSPTFMLALYVIGLTSAHMLVEVAARYHYSGTAVMVILAGIGLAGWVNKNPPLHS